MRIPTAEQKLKIIDAMSSYYLTNAPKFKPEPGMSVDDSDLWMGLFDTACELMEGKAADGGWECLACGAGGVIDEDGVVSCYIPNVFRGGQ